MNFFKNFIFIFFLFFIKILSMENINQKEVINFNVFEKNIKNLNIINFQIQQNFYNNLITKIQNKDKQIESNNYKGIFYDILFNSISSTLIYGANVKDISIKDKINIMSYSLCNIFS